LGAPLLDTFATIPYSQVAIIVEDPPEGSPLKYCIEVGALQDVAQSDVETLLNIAGKLALVR
jgi:hypothetical protein